MFSTLILVWSASLTILKVGCETAPGDIYWVLNDQQASAISSRTRKGPT